MKKTFCFVMFIVIMVFCVSAAAESIDLSTFTDDELRELANSCYSELGRRHVQPSDIGYENEELGISVRMTSLVLTKLNGVELQYNFTAINDSDYEVKFKIADVAVNGWEGMWDSSGTVSAHKKTKSTIQITHLDSNTEIESVDMADQISLLEFKLVVTYDNEKIEIPYEITDLSIMSVKNKK